MFPLGHPPSTHCAPLYAPILAIPSSCFDMPFIWFSVTTSSFCRFCNFEARFA